MGEIAVNVLIMPILVLLVSPINSVKLCCMV